MSENNPKLKSKLALAIEILEAGLPLSFEPHEVHMNEDGELYILMTTMNSETKESEEIGFGYEIEFNQFVRIVNEMDRDQLLLKCCGMALRDMKMKNRNLPL